MVNFYRQHIPHFSAIMSPLFKLTEPFTWTDEANNAFQTIKQALSQVTLLSIPNPNLTYHVFTDASNDAIGATITQRNQPLAFYSSRLSPTEQRYSTFDREALAVIKCLKSYKHWFLGSPVVIHTDHKPLLGLMNMKDPSPKQARWIEFVTQLDVTWTYQPGDENFVADCLSRPISKTTHTNAVTLENIGPSEWEQTLKEYTPSNTENLSSLTLKQVDGIWFDVSKRRHRLLVPPTLRKDCFNLVHNVAHLGIKKTLRSISDRFVWPSMRKDVQHWCSTCQPCQTTKTPSAPQRCPMPFLVHERFHTVHIDIVGPLPSSHSGKQYLLTMIDHFTRWLEAVPISNISAESCAQTFLGAWVSRYGIPVNIVSDQGTQFESNVFSSLLQRLGINKHRTTAYHPQSNGAVERAHRTLKQCIRSVAERNSCWETSLPVVLFAMRTSMSEATQFPPSQLLFGSDLRAPADFIQPNSNVPGQTLTTSEFYENLISDVQMILRSADENQHVRPTQTTVQPPSKKSSLTTPYSGPYEVLQQEQSVVTLQISGKEVRVNIDRVKPALFDEANHRHPMFNTITNKSSLQSKKPNPSPRDDNNLHHSKVPHSSNQFNPSPSDCSETDLANADQDLLSSRYGRRFNFRFGQPRYRGFVLRPRQQKVAGE
jgi:cleavage and polyadenylation specificity factor subunit 1